MDFQMVVVTYSFLFNCFLCSGAVASVSNFIFTIYRIFDLAVTLNFEL